MTFGGRPPTVEDDFGERRPSVEDDLWWKTTFGEIGLDFNLSSQSIELALDWPTGTELGNILIYISPRNTNVFVFFISWVMKQQNSSVLKILKNHQNLGVLFTPHITPKIWNLFSFWSWHIMVNRNMKKKNKRNPNFEWFWVCVCVGGGGGKRPIRTI